MRSLLFSLVLVLLLAFPAYSLFCNQCGQKIGGDSKFCDTCGAQIKKSESSSKVPAMTPDSPKPPKTPPQPEVSKPSGEVFRTKSDLFLYDKRGDEHNVLKKNFLFKPRRYKLFVNSNFKILEIVGDAYLVQSLPDEKGKVLKGWVSEEELNLRTSWKK